MVREKFGWAKVASSFAEICERVASRNHFDETSAGVEEHVRAAV
jgi:hypothetical protein